MAQITMLGYHAFLSNGIVCAPERLPVYRPRTDGRAQVGGWQSPQPQTFLQDKALLSGDRGTAVRTLHHYILEQVSLVAGSS